MFPCYSLFTEFLSLVSNDGLMKRQGAKAHLRRRLEGVLGIHLDTLDTDLRTVESSLVHVTGASAGERYFIDFQKLKWKDVRRREPHYSAAYASEFTQTFPRSQARRIETVESLA